MATKLIMMCFVAPFMILFVQYLYAPSSLGLVREWAIIQETGERVRRLPHKKIHSKKAIVETWETTEGDVRTELDGPAQSDEPQGMWVEW